MYACLRVSVCLQYQHYGGAHVNPTKRMSHDCIVFNCGSKDVEYSNYITHKWRLGIDRGGGAHCSPKNE